ncbi:hypothetical protein DL240_11560 [Lujinxingia litoralis]|uniref:Uncharacterized protein n=1 Tax=Lujinxingia litoralis TaxID=2211119 RepID=A0A328C977_9DELT|nr:hypothetical protein DL240_11560 [Lujinxingia litoralis]
MRWAQASVLASKGGRIGLHLVEKEHGLQGAGGPFARLVRKASWFETTQGGDEARISTRAVCEHGVAREKKNARHLASVGSACRSRAGMGC